MALSKSTITGRVPLPTDENLQFAELTFALSGLDTEGADVLPGGISTRIVLIDSDIPAGFELWQNVAGLRGTHYRVLARWTVKDRDGVREQYADLGVIQIGSDPSYPLADLLNSSVPQAVGTFWSALTQAQYDAVMDAVIEVDRAEAAALQAEAARDATTLIAATKGAYRDTTITAAIAQGVAALTVGDTFTAAADDVDYIGLYVIETGPIAAEIERFPTSALVESRADSAIVRQLFDVAKESATIGRPSTATLVTGSNLGNATYVFGKAAPFAGAITRFRCFALTAGVFGIKVFDRYGNDFTQSGDNHSISVAAGINNIDLLNSGSIPLAEGQYIGVYANGIGCSRSATGGVVADNGGWYSASGDSTSFTDASLNSTYQIQVGIDVEAVLAEASNGLSIVEADITATDGPRIVRQTIGRVADPVAGAGASSAGVYGMADAVAVSGALTRLRVYAIGGSSLIVSIASRNTTIGEFERQRSFTVQLESGLNTLSAVNGDFDALPVYAGEFVTFSVGNGVLAYSPTTADGAGWYSAIDQDPATWSDGTAVMNLRVEIGFDIESRAQMQTAQVPIYWDWSHVIGDGQSNAVGATAGVVINDTSSAYHLTFDSGVKTAPTLTDGDNPATGTQALVEDDVSPITGMTGSAYGDTGLWQFASEFSRRRALAGSVPQLFVSTAGYSGANMAKIAAGSPWYQVMIYQVKKAKEYADGAGKTYGVSAVLFDHGESDQQSGTITKEEYKRLLANKINAFGNEVQAITGQTERPQWLFTTSPYYITAHDTPTEAVNEICRERADCHLVAPGYRFAHRADNLHLSAVGQCVKRSFQARALAALADGLPVPAIRWRGASGSGTSIVVRASSPAPLAINTTLVAAVANSGFAVFDADGTKAISDVALGASAWNELAGAYLTDITITVSTSIGASPVVKYAKTAIGAAPVITSGAAGNVFDTTADQVTVDSVEYSMANAAPPVTLAIYVPE